METERLYYLGVVVDIIEDEDAGITKEYGIIKADIPGIIQGIQAFPKRNELDEPKKGDAVLLLCLDPVLNSYWIYERIKENDFIGIRAAGKMIDITPDYISIGVFDKSQEYKEDERPELTTYLKLDADGNIEIKSTGEAGIEIEGDVNVKVTNGEANIETAGNTVVKSDTYIEVNAPEVEINSRDVKITGGMLTTKGSVTPSGTGPYCALPICPFSGWQHVGTRVTGT